jgi:hypothetical protein
VSLYVHPVMQLLALALALGTLVLAWPRIVTLHLGSKRRFRRARHVLGGQLSLGIFILGAVGGAVAAHTLRGTWLAGGAHAWGGIVLLSLALFGLASGLYLAYAPPRPRKLLPALHGLVNLLVLALALWQVQSGRQMLEVLKALP